ncbi:ABC transporter permease [Streptomyces sp. H10-C2]|uniref:ABC transporter permease n=1 Tax=unclassified Streptomyces TaxID=2593676 RepID=UPI0024B9B148|nr:MULTISPECIES: ABC transporter permease [unclassified Streptomyces]MDJ0345157.1 ABC transporter permease [Streptomyces sp. PH10-H1]MDJ0374125.1 ABC transporter permease [Streptomyces sp. H10-C2]
MTTLSYAVSDSVTMLRRNLKHALRYPSMTVSVVAMPVMMLLLFTYVFGGALGTGIGGTSTGSTHYIDYVAPGIILMAATSGALATAVGVCVDMTEGIVNRFRTMAISRASFLTGHVVGSVIQTLISITLVIGVALLMGFRPNATPIEWIAAAGILALLSLALTWLSAAIGLVAKNPETASNMPMPLQFLPFIGSAIVPPESMPTGLRWFAEYQPFTPIIETLRGLLMGTGIGNSGIIALAWCVGLSVVGYLWARAVFNRNA